MTVAKQVVDALNSANIEGLGKAYSFLIPASSLNSETKALIAVSEIMQLPTEYGSNTYNQMDQRIQVKICYPKNGQINADEFENSISSFFMRKNWLRQSDIGHYIDEQGRIEIDLFFNRRN
ncbi:MAG: hypothetical protein [Caudoviricetes sp.]|nr:MAG: hypothetical protein [Caudoviricetes sp.]